MINKNKPFVFLKDDVEVTSIIKKYMQEMIIYAELSKKTVPRVVIHLLLIFVKNLSDLTCIYSTLSFLFSKKVLGVDQSII